MINKIINKSAIVILLLTNIIVSSYAIAAEITSVSFGGLSNNLTTESRLTIAKDNKTTSIVDQHISKATGKTRTEILNSKANSIKLSKNKPFALSKNNYSNFAEFTIYGATTVLYDDFDYDSFYQTFSVSFDADVISYNETQWGEVYALLYISKSGGPWTHYYTTDNFIIEGKTDTDEYEIITTFLSGYPTDHYDILIDLYQEGDNDIVASYSSNDSNALFALSLESADYDAPYNEKYIEVIEISHGGSFSIVILLLFLITYSVRTSNNSSIN